MATKRVVALCLSSLFGCAEIEEDQLGTRSSEVGSQQSALTPADLRDSPNRAGTPQVQASIDYETLLRFRSATTPSDWRGGDLPGDPLSDQLIAFPLADFAEGGRGGAVYPVGDRFWIALGLRVAAGALAIHMLGLVHGDVKPESIFFPGGQLTRAKLGDLGLIEAFLPDQNLTGAGTVIGTPLYISPEAARGDRRTQGSDVWSLGVVIYECG